MIRLYTCTRIRARIIWWDERVHALTVFWVYAYHGTPLCHEFMLFSTRIMVSVFAMIRVHSVRGIRGDAYTVTSSYDDIRRLKPHQIHHDRHCAIESARSLRVSAWTRIRLSQVASRIGEAGDLRPCRQCRGGKTPVW
jgi:hypothetical protein